MFSNALHASPQFRRSLSAVLAAAFICTPAVHAQGSEPRVGALIVAHGGGDEWNAPVLRAAQCVNIGGPVEVAFLMGPAAATHRFQDRIGRLAGAGAREVVIVPMLVSSHSGHYEQIRYLAGKTDTLSEMMMHHLHLAGLERPTAGVSLTVARALDDAAELGEVLSARALGLTATPSNHALYLVGHGPNSAEDHAEWMTNLRRVADVVKQRTGFANVATGLVRDDAPAAVRAEAVRAVRETIELLARATGREVVVVPILISRSGVGSERIRNDLAGLPVVYSAQPILPHPAIARWIETRVRENAASHVRGIPTSDARIRTDCSD